jgi:DNA polymerase III subunit delta'
VNYFSQIIGQHRAIELLQETLKRDRIAPAYLFVGPDGVGKSLAAKAFSQCLLSLRLSPEKSASSQKRALEGNHPDLLWIEPTYQHQGRYYTAKEATAAGLKRKASPQIRVEQVREIAQFLARPPLEAQRSLVAIENAQAMTEGAANALLKTLEEPGRATIILLASNLDALLPTIVSRCQRIPFYRLASEEMERVLQQVNFADRASPEIIAIAQGSPGEAIAAIEQLQLIPESLRSQLNEPSPTPLAALELAKAIERLEMPTQLWLVDYLQHLYWQRRTKNLLELLEKTRQYLLAYVQPRLVWECTLLAIAKIV